MLKRVFFLFFVSLFVSNLHAGIMQFTGYYSGKNLFVENDILSNGKDRCITNVYVNSKHLSEHPTVSIVEINLSSFKIGDTLTFRIYHKDGCTPRLINKHEIDPKTNHFAFNNLIVNEINIHWETKGEEAIGKFSVEQHINGQWKAIQNLKGVGTKSANTYTANSHTLAGDNKYRVKYKAAGGLIVTSEEVFYHSTKPPVVFYPKRVVDFITFESTDHREVEFAVLDDLGNPLFDGKAMLIDCRHLPSGRYYTIRYENKEEKFFKKDLVEVDVNTDVGK